MNPRTKTSTGCRSSRCDRSVHRRTTHSNAAPPINAVTHASSVVRTPPKNTTDTINAMPTSTPMPRSITSSSLG